MKMEKIPVYEKWRKIRYIFSKKNSGTWRSNRVVPDVPADYVGRPTRLGKLVELLLTEEACKTWEARQEERGIFFSPKMQPTWDAPDLVAAGCNALCRGAGSCSRGLQRECA